MTAETTISNTALDFLNKTFLLNFPQDAARKIEAMPPQDAAALLEEQSTNIIVPVWSKLVPGVAATLLLHLSTEKALSLLNVMEMSSSAAILSRIDQQKQAEFLVLMEGSISKELKELLDYPSDTAGKLMSTRAISFHKDISVKEAVAQLKHKKIEEVSHLFLLDDDLHLHSEVNLKKLILADQKQKLSSLSMPISTFARVLDPKQEITEKFETLKVNAIPVLDGNDFLVGIIQSSDLIEVFQENIAADIQTMVGVSKEERALSSIWFAVKKRQPWLQINLLTAFLAAAVVGMFEDTIAKYTALAILLPIAAGQSGNTGAQSLAVIMRGLTLREITVRHWFRVITKEAGAAVINGIAIAITCGLGVYLWSNTIGLALIISLAMISSMTIAAVSGALVPIVLKRLGQDPALSSSIILTTVTDIAGFMSFLGIATMLSGMLTPG